MAPATVSDNSMAKSPVARTVPPETIAEWLLETLAHSLKHYERLRHQCSRSSKPEPIHRLRVETRRLLALVTLATSLGAGSGHRIRRRLKRTLHATTKLRDVDVQRATLAGLRDRPAALRSFVRKLQHKRKKLEKDVSSQLRRQDPTLVRHIRRLEADLNQRPVHAPSKIFARMLHPLWQRAHETVAQAQSDSSRLHDARIALKALRYASEVISPLAPKAFAQSLTLLRRLQHRLGQIHDDDVLRVRLDRFIAKHPRHAEALKAFQNTLAKRSARRRHALKLRLPAPPEVESLLPLTPAVRAG